MCSSTFLSVKGHEAELGAVSLRRQPAALSDKIKSSAAAAAVFIDMGTYLPKRLGISQHKCDS